MSISRNDSGNGVHGNYRDSPQYKLEYDSRNIIASIDFSFWAILIDRIVDEAPIISKAESQEAMDLKKRLLDSEGWWLHLERTTEMIRRWWLFSEQFYDLEEQEEQRRCLDICRQTYHDWDRDIQIWKQMDEDWHQDFQEWEQAVWKQVDEDRYQEIQEWKQAVRNGTRLNVLRISRL